MIIVIVLAHVRDDAGRAIEMPRRDLKVVPLGDLLSVSHPSADHMLRENLRQLRLPR